MDPRKVESKDDFFYQYVTAWGFSNAADEILKTIESFVHTYEFLKNKEENGDDNKFRIGA